MKRDSDYSSDRQEVLTPALHRKAPSLLRTMCMVLCVALIFGVAAKVCAGQTAIASKRHHDFYISLTSNSGKLVAGKNEYCVLLSRANNGALVYVENVLVEFAQQAGKIRESPRQSSLSRDNLGRYCGEVDLGRQYYQPAFYYVTIHYTDSSKKRSCRFVLTLK
jgi:hypothetical protein